MTPDPFFCTPTHTTDTPASPVLSLPGCVSLARGAAVPANGAQKGPESPRIAQDGRTRTDARPDAGGPSDRRVPVGGVWLPADELARVLAAHATGRLLEDRRRRDGPSFRAGPWLEAARRVSACAQDGPVSLPAPRLVGVNGYAGMVSVSPATVRRWCSAGLLRGAVKAGRDWQIPADVDPPTRGTQR